jgi:plasmid stability protein
MATLIIRDIPEVTYKRLKDRAEIHRRSLTKEALVMLEERLNPYEAPAIDFRKAPQIKFKKKVDLSIEAIEAAINEGRD